MQKEMVIEVACLVDFDELDPDDRNEMGECSVDGSYGLTLSEVPVAATRDDVIEAASLHFHRHVAIACLDDFEITFRDRNCLDQSVHELGEYPFEQDEAPEP